MKKNTKNNIYKLLIFSFVFFMEFSISAQAFNIDDLKSAITNNTVERIEDDIANNSYRIYIKLNDIYSKIETVSKDNIEISNLIKEIYLKNNSSSLLINNETTEIIKNDNIDVNIEGDKEDDELNYEKENESVKSILKNKDISQEIQIKILKKHKLTLDDVKVLADKKYVDTIEEVFLLNYVNIYNGDDYIGKGNFDYQDIDQTQYENVKFVPYPTWKTIIFAIIFAIILFVIVALFGVMVFG